MSPLVTLESIAKSLSGRQLFQDLSFAIFKGDRIGLIGRNGSGKSTLLKMVAGLEVADSGTLSIQRGLRIGYMPQESTFPALSVEEVVLRALAEERTLDEHEKRVKAAIFLGKVGFTEMSQPADKLSGGWKKRLEIARQLAQEPDLLLLDEPTNHLDLEGVLWLEKFLERQAMTFLVISHDRYFLENTTNRMLELGTHYPKGVFASEGGYRLFLERRDTFLKGQVEYERSLASKVRRELEWLSRGPKARTTKSRSRIEAAERLISEHADVKTRNQQNSTSIDFSGTARETRKLLAAHNLGKSLAGRELFQGIDLILSPGTRLGIIGANGTGKTTLLKLFAGQMSPDKGTIKLADGVRIVLFDQLREELPSHLTLKEALSPTSDRVNYRGQMIHVNGWCQRFLFSPDKLELPVNRLSGGERARILIARLMVQPADILLLDEPTNDLDIETLEILEESLMDFPGAVVLITHDRFLMEEVCNVFIGIDASGKTAQVADYSQWETIKKEWEEAAKPAPKATPVSPAKKQERRPKLSYREEQELQQIQQQIPLCEKKVAEWQEKTSLLQGAELQAACVELHLAEEELERLYQRWQELEDKR